MCVAALAWQAHPRWRLVAAANRDEYHERPSAALARWDSGIFAGRDLRAGGTWLGATEAGRFAMVTNYRVPGYPKPDMASRGGLVTDWLEARPLPAAGAMNPFHLICADAAAAIHLSNYPQWSRTALTCGLHGVSNGAFDLPWPKTRRLLAALQDWLDGSADQPELLLEPLADRTPLPREADSEGPEQPFSPVFIADPVYGTRCSTVVAIGHDGRGTMIERRFDAAGTVTGETALAIGG